MHDYLGMTFDFSEDGKVKVDMKDYMAKMVDDFSIKFGPDEVAPTQHTEDLFTEGARSESIFGHQVTGRVSHRCCQGSVCLQASKTRHSTCHCLFVHQGSQA